jgi:DNA-binding NtrC family response regulator
MSDATTRIGSQPDDTSILNPQWLGEEMQRLYEMTTRVARARLNVLITGDTGTGKEVLARTIHRLSPRAGGPFLAINCAGLPPTLMESELFGHERGAFTGAASSRLGLFEAAQHGTLLLDEVGELPIELQAKLLRVIEERLVLPIGAVKPRPIDVRILAATHRDLQEAARAGTFRQDLYYRLSGITLTIPPLRNRPEEIPFLAAQFVREGAGREQPPRVSEAALELLRAQPWPGNIRQLRNVLCRALLFGDGEEVTIQNVVEALELEGAIHALIGPGIGPSNERLRIQQALDQCGGNQTRAARLLGVGRRTLVNKLRIYNFPRPRMEPTAWQAG